MVEIDGDKLFPPDMCVALLSPSSSAEFLVRVMRRVFSCSLAGLTSSLADLTSFPEISASSRCFAGGSPELATLHNRLCAVLNTALLACRCCFFFLPLAFFEAEEPFAEGTLALLGVRMLQGA
eukprot:scaffold48891_cov42-Prasinocladus_malaysianus.AAC.1